MSRPDVAVTRVRVLTLLTQGLLALSIILLGLLPRPLPAQAQEQAQPQPIGVRLTAIDGTLRADTSGGDSESLTPLRGTLELDPRREDREDLRLVMTLYSRVSTPEDLNAALMGNAEATYASVSMPLDDLPAGLPRQLQFEASASSLELTGEDLEGVYPLELRVFQGAEPVGVINSAIVVQPSDARAAMRASLVVSVDAATLPGVDAILDGSLQSLVAPDAPLVAGAREMADLTADGSAAGTTLALNGRLLADLADLADGADLGGGNIVDSQSRIARRANLVVDRIRGLAMRGDVEVLATPYGPADLVALTRGGQGGQLPALVRLGRDAVREVLGPVRLADILLPPDGLDGDTVAALGPAGADAILLDSRYVTFPEADTLEPVRPLRTADGGEVRILVPDAGLSDLLQDPRDVGLAAVVQRLRAETALRWMAADAPSSQALLLHTTIPGHPTPGALAAVSDALATTPWLRPVSLTTLSQEVSVSDRGVRLAYPPSSRAAELDGDYIAMLGQARTELAPLQAMLPDADTTPSRFARSLQVAASVAYRGVQHRDDGLARIRQVLSTIEGLREAVQVIEGPPITLTSSTGEIPVALVNNADMPLRVRVGVASTRFAFDTPSKDLTLAPLSVQTVTFRARALTPGALAGVGVLVEDPTGGVRLVSSTLAVRSTAFPVVALAVTVGGVLLLLAYGIRQMRRRRSGDAQDGHDAARDVA